MCACLCVKYIYNKYLFCIETGGGGGGAGGVGGGGGVVFKKYNSFKIILIKFYFIFHKLTKHEKMRFLFTFLSLLIKKKKKRIPLFSFFHSTSTFMIKMEYESLDTTWLGLKKKINYHKNYKSISKYVFNARSILTMYT